MTSTAALILAISLLIHEVHLLYDGRVLNNKYLSSNLVYLMSVCLILREISIFPKLLRRKFSFICFVLEIPLAIIVLEISLLYLWTYVQQYILQTSDDILVRLTEEKSFEWLVCQLCCGQNNCSDIFGALVLKLTSFVVLLSVVCTVVRN